MFTGTGHISAKPQHQLTIEVWLLTSRTGSPHSLARTQNIRLDSLLISRPPNTSKWLVGMLIPLIFKLAFVQ